mgnify:CR=1 FL=1
MQSKFSTFTTIVVLIMSSFILFSLQSCGNDKIISKASEAISHRDYKTALNEILSLSDETILESDTLSQMLSTAYYGSTLKPTRDIAVDCYDLDLISKNKQVVFTDFHNGSLNFYSFPEMQFIRSILLPEKAYAIDFSPNEEIFATALVNNNILIYETSTGKKLKELEGHTNRVRDVVFRDNELLFSCGNDQKVAAWDVTSGEPYWGKHQHSKNIKSLQMSKDRSKMITASNDGSASLLKAAGDRIGAEELRFIHGDNYVNDAAISPNNKYAVTVSGDGYAKIWDAENGCSLHYIFLNDPLGAVDISDNSKLVLVGGQRNVFIIDADEGKVICKINVMNKPVWSVRFLDGKQIAFADNSHFWHTTLLIGKDLITEARKSAQ